MSTSPSSSAAPARTSHHLATTATAAPPSTPTGPRAAAAATTRPVPPLLAPARPLPAAGSQPFVRSANGNLVRTREWHQIKCFHQYLMIRPHQNEWKALHQPRAKWLADMRQHSPGLAADRAVALFAEHFEQVGKGDLWRIRFNRRSANPLEWISVDFFSKGRALDPKFLRFLMSMTWRMKTPAFRARVPLAEFVRDRTEAEDRDAKDTFLLAHRFLYDACPQGLCLELPAPLPPALRAPLEEWAARELVEGALGTASGMVRVHVKRDALDLVTYDQPLLPHLLAATAAQRPEARAHYRKIIAKEAKSRTCFFRLYADVRFLTVFGPLEPALAALIAAAPVGGAPSSGASTASRGSGAAAKRGGGEARKKGSGGKKRKAGGGGGAGSKKQIKREEGDEGYVGAGSYGAGAKRQLSDRARRAVVGKPRADDDFCYSWDDDEEDEGSSRRSSLGSSRGGQEEDEDGSRAAGEGTHDMLPSQDDYDWPADDGYDEAKPSSSLTPSSSSSCSSGAMTTAGFPILIRPISTTAACVSATATTTSSSTDGKKSPVWHKDLESAVSAWFPKSQEGDHTTLYEAPCDPNDPFERWTRRNGMTWGTVLAISAASSPRLPQTLPPLRDAPCCDKTTMTGADGAGGGEEGDDEEEGPSVFCQEVAAILAPFDDVPGQAGEGNDAGVGCDESTVSFGSLAL